MATQTLPTLTLSGTGVTAYLRGRQRTITDGMFTAAEETLNVEVSLARGYRMVIYPTTDAFVTSNACNGRQ